MSDRLDELRPNAYDENAWQRPDAAPSSPQPAEDLERVLAEIDRQLAAWDRGGHSSALTLDITDGVTIRAALARERELREVLVELVEHPGHLRRTALTTDNDQSSGLTYFCEFCGNAQYDEHAAPMFLHPEWCLKRKAKALLAQPAAGEADEQI